MIYWIFKSDVRRRSRQSVDWIFPETQKRDQWEAKAMQVVQRKGQSLDKLSVKYSQRIISLGACHTVQETVSATHWIE